MERPFRVPELDTLASALRSVLLRNGCVSGHVNILNRQPNFPESTFPCEIVTCRVDGQGVLRLFCKYTAGRDHNAFGHRGGVAYEAEVYEHVLQRLPVPAARFYGRHEDAETGETWLIMEYLENTNRLKNTHSREQMAHGARWSARFHALGEGLQTDASLAFLTRYDADYYLGWARRTAEFAGRLHDRFPWLHQLCDRFETLIPELLSPPLTTIHGEYYPPNILVRDD